MAISITKNGTVLLATTYGIAAYDPLSKKAEWLVHWADVDELRFKPVLKIPNIVGLDASTILFNNEIEPRFIGHLTIDFLSSKRNPARSILRLPNDGFELRDTSTQQVWKYDLAGRLVEQRKRTGETDFTVTYLDARSERLDSITDAVGRQLTFNYVEGKLKSINDPAGRITKIAINDQGDLVGLEEPDGEAHSFAYDNHQMTSKTSPGGDVTKYIYAADGTVIKSIKPSGEMYSFEAALAGPVSYDDLGKTTYRGTYTDARGVIHEFQTNVFGEIEKENVTADGVSYVRQRVYAEELFGPDESSTFPVTRRKNSLLLTSHNTLNGVPLSAPLTYDSMGRAVQQTRFLSGPGSSVTQVMQRDTYDRNGWLLQSYSGPSSTAQRRERDGAGRLLQLLDVDVDGFVSVQPQSISGRPTGRGINFTWRGDGLLAAKTEHEVTTTYRYDDSNGSLNLLSTKDTLGRTMAFTYDKHGNLASATDGTSSISLTYDSNNRVTEVSDALGNVTQFEYIRSDGRSEGTLVTGIHTPDLAPNVKWRLSYGSEDRLSIVTDPLGFTKSYVYERTGELASLTDRLGRTTRMSYDSLGRLAGLVDTLGRKREWSYTVPKSGAWTGPTLITASPSTNGKAKGLSDPLTTGEYQIGLNAYDTEGFPARISFYRDATFALGYSHYFDSGMRLTARVDRTAEAFHSNLVPLPSDTGTVAKVQIAYEGASPAPLIRDVANPKDGGYESASFGRNLEQDVTLAMGYGGGAATPPAIYTYTRDMGGRVTALSRHYIAEGPLTADSPSTYSYRSDGRIQQVSNIDGVHDFTYDERGLIKTQTILNEGTYTYHYDEMGRNNLLVFPDGHLRRQSYDLLGRIFKRCYEYPSNVDLNRCYGAEFDAESNPVRLTDPEGVDHVEYDALDRIIKLTRVTNGGGSNVETYAYNALGALKINAGTNLDHQRPRLDGAGNDDAPVPNKLNGQVVTLDKGGRVTSLGSANFTWNMRGDLIAVAERSTHITFKYDAYHRRASQPHGNQQEAYVYEGDNRVGTIVLNTGLPKETYLFDGIDHPLRMKRGASVIYYELDLAGNVRRLRGPNGSDKGGYRYKAFGQTIENTAGIDQPLRWKSRWIQNFGGHEIYDVRARQWSPELGAFLSIDEYAYHDPMSTLWGWPNQNPVRFNDPNGHFAAALAPALAGAGIALNVAGALFTGWMIYDLAANHGKGIVALGNALFASSSKKNEEKEDEPWTPEMEAEEEKKLKNAQGKPKRREGDREVYDSKAEEMENKRRDLQEHKDRCNARGEGNKIFSDKKNKDNADPNKLWGTGGPRLPDPSDDLP